MTMEMKEDGMISLLFRQRLARGQSPAPTNGLDKHSLCRLVEKPPALRYLRHKRRRSLGQGLVELTLVLPTLLLLMMGAVDLGRVFYAYTAIGSAAYQAARQSARGGYLFTACKSTDSVSCDAS